jgi:hypothetical protein
MEKAHPLLCAVVLCALVSCQSTTPQPDELSQSAYYSSSLGSCSVFPKDHIWNTPVDTLPRYWNSYAYAQAIGVSRGLRAGMGSTAVGGYDGIPYIVVTNAKRKFPFALRIMATRVTLVLTLFLGMLP